MEYAESDLKKIIKSNIHLELLHIETIIYNLLCAIKYLHESNVLHRDLKPANVLINEDCTVKLCDYGLARSISGIPSAAMILSKHEKQEVGHSNLLGNSSLSVASAQSQNDQKKLEPAETEEQKQVMTQKLVKTKDARRNMKRELTGHV
jgi:serine/threonine protein kinase